MRRAAIATFALSVSLMFSGCYDPHPPGGAYLCSPDDHGCPTGQHCTCGLCVNQDSQAACRFTISDNASGAQKLTVLEHQSFPITISALDKNGAPASGFGGTVQLSSSWGDVKPPTATLKGGTATVMVQLNRETLSPAVAIVSASFNGNLGKSPGINVQAPTFALDPTEINAPFGWATNLAAEAAVTKVGNDYQMYFVGQAGPAFGIGMATSADGRTFTPTAAPLLQGAPGQLIFSPSVYQTSSGTLMAFAVGSQVALASSADGKTFTPLSGNMFGLTPNQCSYCKGTSGGEVTFPQVMPDVLAPTPDGGAPPWLMFFSALTNNSDGSGSVSVGRASSSDGKSWTPEPAPILSGDLTGEVVLLSPRVLLDGSIYKMWYSFARKLSVILCLGTGQSTCPANYSCVNLTCTPNDPGDAFHAFCENSSQVEIGYATSSDGFFWTKSIHNPVISIPSGSADHAYLVSSVLPTDGVDAASGVTLYYSAFRRAVTTMDRCLPNGIKRATRP